MTADSTQTRQAARRWVVIDADGRTLGRLASQITGILRGKHKPEFAPNLDCGDGVVVINARKVRVTGRKLEQKYYYRHSGYPGGLKRIRLDQLLEKQPEQVIRRAVRGMLPDCTLGRGCFKRLRVYAGAEHPHTAQQPVIVE